MIRFIRFQTRFTDGETWVRRTGRPSGLRIRLEVS